MVINYLLKVYKSLRHKISVILGLEITFQIGKFKLMITRDHDLPNIINYYPNYQNNLTVIAREVQKKYHDLIIIDIGANIGDTVAILRNKIYCPIISIEGNKTFFRLLRKNINNNFNQVTAYNLYLGDKNRSSMIQTSRKAGTFSLVSLSGKREKIALATLDSVVSEINESSRTKLLKIDTDGYDLKIIKGGLNYISRVRPIIFFEFNIHEYHLRKESLWLTLSSLEKAGYKHLIVFDNFGNKIIGISLKEKKVINQLVDYVNTGTSPVVYYDLCVFHSIDQDLYNKTLSNI